MARKGVLYDSKVNGYLFSETFFTRPSNTCYMAFQKVLEGLPAKNL